MRVLLTGASGFLGKTIHRGLKHLYDIKTLGRTEDSDILCDLSKQVPNLPEFYNGIIHCAGKAHIVPKTKSEEEEFIKVNYEGTINLLQGLLSLTKPEFFIFISTVAVYGRENGKGISEEHPLNGETPYAKSKILAEEYLKTWALENNVRLSILRLPLVAGLNPPGNLGAMIYGIRKGRYFGIGKSEAKKSVVWAEDIGSIIPILSNNEGTYNLTDGYHPTFCELEICISNALGKKNPYHIPISLARVIAKAGDILGNKAPLTSSKLNKMMSTLVFDDSKARRLLNWTPSKVLDKLPLVL